MTSTSDTLEILNFLENTVSLKEAALDKANILRLTCNRDTETEEFSMNDFVGFLSVEDNRINMLIETEQKNRATIKEAILDATML